MAWVKIQNIVSICIYIYIKQNVNPLITIKFRTLNVLTFHSSYYLNNNNNNNYAGLSKLDKKVIYLLVVPYKFNGNQGRKI